ncbi:ABC transporter substrate-binding protein [Frankia nepalensis]|uniref:ABC transporter substrate-binding protein n=1 Tax=Frankia nepalensis TaxID=1836974 RepID=UPI001EE45D6E|nr:ABC transporter substrate-binding protein [Frankia nepalensis]
MGTRLGVAACLAGSLLITACGGDGGESTGGPAADQSAELLGPVARATGAPIRIGIVSDGKSPVSDQSIEFAAAAAAVKYLNEHKSGIGGRPIELVECESIGDPGKTSDCANQMIEEDVVAVIGGTTSAGESLAAPLQEANMPLVVYGATGSALLLDKESTFALSDSIEGQIGVAIQAAKDAGASKVTAVVIDVPAATAVQRTIAPDEYKKAGLSLNLVTVPPGTADMTAQIQKSVADDPGLVFVIGNDSFCIGVFKSLLAVGHDGPVAAISQCVTDSTRKQIPTNFLDGMRLSAVAPVGDNPSSQFYKAVATTYAKDIDTSRPAGMGVFISVLALQAAVGGITGDVNPQTILTTIKTMPEMELPASAGLRFRCNGKANSITPAVCTSGGLTTTLDAEGLPTAYQIVGAAPVPD